MGRILAIDYGLKRTGIAVTDEMGSIAFGLTTVATEDIFVFLKKYMTDENVTDFVVGEPKQMNNEPSEAEALILPFLEELAKNHPTIKIHRQDERFTSKMAFQSMLDAGLGKKQRKNKALIDEISATIILQSFLERS
ncbi:Holliday junction resolvase RuvX [Maribacter sp. MJ134]|uniref:Holliday junction resolvase RuvX n=1 Tax=Maribacter sp. MJ134 TaxID=2496865 RepID=UPI000F82F2F5|nr:Holliday junction resolvase RuvX [Maribacter sp. MJ134]AZQ58734.1 Holliday junction resolvase RuvX [Maribacter sp. MJ134]